MFAFLEPVGADNPTPRAFLRVGGRMVAQRQLALALALDRQKIICIARAVTGEVIALQREAERAGAGFHVVRNARGLIGMVAASDDIVVLADGVLPDIAQGAAFCEQGQAVGVLPIDEGLARGFERVDLNHATSGIMWLPGNLVERLAELDGDCDAVSALARIALQKGMPTRDMPAGAREAGAAWRIIRDDEQAHAAEVAWIAAHLRARGAPAPGHMLVASGLRAFGPAMLHRGGSGRMAVLFALASLVIALGCGWFGLTGLALVGCAIAWGQLRAGAILAAIEDGIAPAAAEGARGAALLTWLVDAAMVLVLAWSAPGAAGETAGWRAFAPVMLVGLLRLVPSLAGARAGAWFEDRVLAAAVLGLLSATGLLAGAMPLLAAGLLAGGIALASGRSRLTRD